MQMAPCFKFTILDLKNQGLLLLFLKISPVLNGQDFELIIYKKSTLSNILKKEADV